MAAERQTMNQYINSLSDNQIESIIQHLRNREPNNNIKIKTKTRRGYVRYTRKNNLTINDKKSMIKYFYKNILQNNQLLQSKINNVYTWIIRGGNLITGTAEELNTQFLQNQITIYASRVKTKQETGSLHQNLDLLTYAFYGDNKPITAAGEYQVNKNGYVDFNLRSGTYMYQGSYRMLSSYTTNPQILNLIQKNRNTIANNQIQLIDKEIFNMFNEIARRVTYIFQNLLRFPATYKRHITESGGDDIIPKFDIYENEANRSINQYYNRIVENTPNKHPIINNNSKQNNKIKQSGTLLGIR